MRQQHLRWKESETASPETVEVVKEEASSSGNQISDEDQMIWENTGSFTKECQVSEEIRSYSSVKVADISPKVQNSSASKLKKSDALSDS
ncbi:uncharacterized protein Pyn_33630 [Prunus yedoensis var. nudiflora]|uniref:Uncharacterized protein n=1 Tax=Prunus yedoensis var. nudiflora TaxID=2094558 RepID=A0A314Z0B5_PRUYE|nr:uncharacterized protein Pyn_33630 [Prunus yedoensis var. nudiflora]